MSPVSNVGILSKGVTVKIDENLLTPSFKVTVIVIVISGSEFNGGLILNVPDKYVTYNGFPANVTCTVFPSGSEYKIEYIIEDPLKTY